MPENAGQTIKQNVRQTISSKEELRSAVVTVTGLADRTLAIMTPDLEPDIYDHEAFLDALKRFILARSFARVRVLISDPSRTMKIGNGFVDMGRRLNSYIEFRNLKPEYRSHADAYCIADTEALVYRPRGDRWDGVCDTYDPGTAKKYLNIFDDLWNASETQPALRRLEV